MIVNKQIRKFVAMNSMIFCNLFCELNSLSADLETGVVGFDAQATRISNQLVHLFWKSKAGMGFMRLD